MIRNYQVGVYETQSLVQIDQVTDGTDQFLKIDGVLTNVFSELYIYSDSGGTSPLTEGTDYDMTTTDTTLTTNESGTGGSGKTVYSQFEITNATYQNVDLWVTCTNFGTYTDNDAPFTQIGGSESISSESSVSIPDGYHRYYITVDTSSADVTATLGDGQFAGQEVRVKCDGDNLAYVLGTGLYTGDSSTGVPVSDGLMLRAEWDGSEWIAVNEITADYDSDAFNVKQWSTGIMEIIHDRTKTEDINTSNGNVYVSDSLGEDTFPVSFTEDNPVVNIGLRGAGVVWPAINSRATSTTTIGYYAVRSSAGSSVGLAETTVYKGTY